MKRKPKESQEPEICCVDCEHYWACSAWMHGTLLEYLIRTYTNDGDTILDNCMGSGSTGVAVKRVGGRRFIGIEQNDDYYQTAKERIEKE